MFWPRIITLSTFLIIYARFHYLMADVVEQYESEICGGKNAVAAECTTSLTAWDVW